MALVASIMCVDDDLQQFCRRLVTLTSPGTMHLSQVVATGAQIYPVRVDTIRGTATLLRCEFRMRKTGSAVTPLDATALLDRIRSCHVLDSYLVDSRGVNLGPVEPYPVAS